MNMGKPNEGLEYAKLGCKNNIKSGFSWHILGLIYKSMNNYEEAAKSFRTSLRNDKDNITVLKDLSNCNAQIREFGANVELRKQILYQRPTSYAHWLALWAACIIGNSDILKDIGPLIESLFENQIDSLFAEFKASTLLTYSRSDCVRVESRTPKEIFDIDKEFLNLYV